LDKEAARYTLFVAYKAYSELAKLIPIAIPNVKNYAKRDDIDAKLYKGVFNASHVIIEELIDTIIKEYPELDNELETIMNRFKRLP